MKSTIDKSRCNFYIFKRSGDPLSQWKILMAAKLPKDTRGYEIVGPFTKIYECYKEKKEEVKV